jgi:hypothetical protein
VYSVFGSKLKGDLAKERDQLFAIALVNFDNDQQIHHQLLQTVYMKITGNAEMRSPMTLK